MKTRYIFRLLLALGVLPLLLGACSKDEIIFDHELPQFETRPGLQLLEVIMPQGTSATDRLYIVGEFNGGLDAALADPRWQLEKASGNDAKWGIYLDPASFVDGKTLADGYYFYSREQREERTLANAEVLHTEAPAVGGRLNVTAVRWAAYFDKPVDPGEITHDGYVIYVVDNSGYDELAMYAWATPRLSADGPECSRPEPLRSKASPTSTSTPARPTRDSVSTSSSTTTATTSSSPTSP